MQDICPSRDDAQPHIFVDTDHRNRCALCHKEAPNIVLRSEPHTVSEPNKLGEPRDLSDIAWEIRRTWKKVNYGAVPYLDAMFSLGSIDENYGYDSAESVVRYFLSNASTWRGGDARRIKAELKNLLGDK